MKITFINSTVDFSRTLNACATTAENNKKKKKSIHIYWVQILFIAPDGCCDFYLMSVRFCKIALVLP